MHDLTPMFVVKHEEQHLPQCPSCDGVTTSEKLRFKETVSEYGGECLAYRAGSKCLKTKLSNCGKDNECRKEIKRQLEGADDRARLNCRAWAIESLGR